MSDGHEWQTDEHGTRRKRVGPWELVVWASSPDHIEICNDDDDIEVDVDDDGIRVFGEDRRVGFGGHRYAQAIPVNIPLDVLREIVALADRGDADA